MNTYDNWLPYFTPPIINERWFVMYQYTDSLGRIIQISGKEGGTSADVIQTIIHDPSIKLNHNEHTNTRL